MVDTLALLGDPQGDYPSIHVTGTNGKGTTTTLTSALLGAMGLRVGTFTSPDLHAINERIAVNADPVDDEAFIALLSRLADVESVSGIELTRFVVALLRRGSRRGGHRSRDGWYVGLHQRH
jgi:dihydrofolate synthase/folylpolyglutamate synthase